jgi:hypothetical protein
MTVTSLSVKIAGVEYSTIVPDTKGNITGGNPFVGNDKIEQRSTCEFTIYDANGIYAFKKGQSVVVTDSIEGIIFSGVVQSIVRTTDVWPHVYHDITCSDKMAILDGQTSNEIYNEEFAGAIAVDQVKNEWANGILANFAIDNDTTQADFAAGNLSGTVAAANAGDGDLELAPAGATITITESTTSVFNSGTLTNMTASNNALGPSATSAMRIQATQSVQGLANSYTYLEFWNAGGITIVSGRYFTYDLWIASSSPQAMIGVDLVFTDGTAYRDQATSNNGEWFDAQNKSPHPGTDLGGLAVDTWYHRSFLMDNFVGKTIAYAMIAIEGNNAGEYTGYVKNVVWLDSGGTNHGTFFSGSLGVSPPKQMQRQGYGVTSLTVVNTYDCSTASRVSPSYSIDPTKILKSSYLAYKTSLPTGYTFTLQYSIDGGNSYTPITSNNASLPALLAGQSIASKSIQFLATFSQGAGAEPTQQPLLTFMQAMLYPSYTASKSDINGEWTTNAQWNAGANTNTQASSNTLSPFGAVRNWDSGSISGAIAGQTLFGGGATGPNTATTCFQYVDSKQFRLQLHQSTEARSRLDFTGTWGDFQMEFDVSVDNTLMKVGCCYRTTGWSNYDGTYAYAIEIIGTTIKLFKGSNNAGASSNFSPTQVGPTATVNLTSQAMHRIKVIAIGSAHSIYFDDTLAISATDSTYTSAGNVGFRISNTDPSNGYIGTFDNFGISITNVFNGANWTSQSVSLTGAGTYLNSVVQWDDISTDPTQVANNLWASVNGGSSWQQCTNGGPLPNLTPGQSLSGVSLLLQMLFSYNTSTVLPEIQDLTVYVLGGFSSTGTRINKALLLSGVGVCGSTLVSMNALTPANTSVALATSLDGVTYTSVSNGGSISGINQQPSPTIDTFNLITSASYTSTARTGGTATSWIEDTTNSRLTVSGGTNALLLYGAISCKDVDISFDLDEADNAGVVWRWTSASNYYELLVFDGSSSAGATNKIRLFKVVANVKTQIGSDLPITLARGSIVKRARVTMIGTAIVVYFDGTQLLSTTDSALAGPGQVGFSNVSGVARFYNLRIQPQGDNLSGKFVYVKQTLTSTDPTQTPQITGLTTLVTNPNIAIGSLISTANYVNTYKSDNIKNLCGQSNYYNNIKHDGSFIFLPRQTIPAPWVLTNQDILPDNMEVDDSADLYRSRHTMIGVQSTVSQSDTFMGDGSSTSWDLKYKVVSVSSVLLDGQVQTFGVKGVDSGKDFYYEVGATSFVQDSSGTVLQEIDSLVVSYTGQSTTTVTRDNTGQFPGTVSQKQYIDQSGLSIPVQIILNQASAAVSTSGNSDDLDVSLVKKIAFDANITAQSGTSPTVRFFVDRKGADGNYYQIYDSGVISALTSVSTTIGPKCDITEVLGFTVRIRWTIGGSASPTKTLSISIQGRVDPVLANIGIVEMVEDVSSLGIDVPTAQARGDAALQENGVQGRTFKFETKRTGLSVGQDLSVFLPGMQINDASMLVTSVQRNQQFKMTAGSPDQTYIFQVEASEGPVLTSWGNTLNNALGGQS